MWTLSCFIYSVCCLQDPCLLSSTLPLLVTQLYSIVWTHPTGPPTRQLTASRLFLFVFLWMNDALSVDLMPFSVRSCVFSSLDNCWVWVWSVSLRLPIGSSVFEGWGTFRRQSLAGESRVTQDEPWSLIVKDSVQLPHELAPITMLCRLSLKIFHVLLMCRCVHGMC